MGVSIEHQMIELYCFVDEFLKTHPRLAHGRRSPHAQPQFSDAEVLTIALLQGVFEGNRTSGGCEIVERTV